ncbi:hypothetical protein Micbo1qcDRAFT_63853 [Microdochium bolleyi]|uniref:Uncharacterized protein n=1 Tax=Microdochium bolleyi TaxID=196109 RepID=A0A136J1X9_9PEZI|nr:hypothetical protein Micbo1qcDRAFT_63853 [Microdochium bolleyi]
MQDGMTRVADPILPQASGPLELLRPACCWPCTAVVALCGPWPGPSPELPAGSSTSQEVKSKTPRTIGNCKLSVSLFALLSAGDQLNGSAQSPSAPLGTPLVWIQHSRTHPKPLPVPIPIRVTRFLFVLGTRTLSQTASWPIPTRRVQQEALCRRAALSNNSPGPRKRVD